MILGIGTDLTDIRRIEKALSRFGKRFEDRLFTPKEQDVAHSKASAGSSVIAATYAKRFAAKEAVYKALPGLKNTISLRDIEILNTDTGAPTVTLHQSALAYLQSITPAHHTPVIHISLSDEYPYAQAYVIISIIPQPH